MKGKIRHIILFVSFLLLGNQNSSFSQCYLRFSGIDTLIDHAVDLVHSEQYFDAIKICEDIISDNPDNPMGYLGAAVIYHGIMRNYWINHYEPQFDSLLTISIEKGEQAIKKYENDAECYFMYGAALGFRGMHRIRKGQWFGAFIDGIKGYRNLKKSYDMNDELYDAYYGLGLYYYWKSSKAKVFTFLRLMKDEREKGIEFIKIAIDKGRFASLEGQFALVEIYYYEGRFDEAYQECLALQNRFSDDPTWLYIMAKLLQNKQQWNESKQFFQKIVGRLETSPFPRSMGFFAACHYGIAKCSYQLKNFDNALKECEIAMEYATKRDSTKEIDGPLLDFDLVLERLKKLSTKIKISIKTVEK